MPYKVNEKRRHKIPKARYRVQNGRDYDAALRRRGDLTTWVTPAAMAAWKPTRCRRLCRINLSSHRRSWRSHVASTLVIVPREVNATEPIVLGRS
jgi:hypothetical protein